MGAGRKTQTFYAGESVAWSPLSGDGSILTRNLVKDELGGVIFGCRHCTMQECLSKQLFGMSQYLLCICTVETYTCHLFVRIITGSF